MHSHNLLHPEEPDIAAIPISVSDYIHKSRHFSEEQSQHKAGPKNFSLLKQRFLSWHERLNHFPKKNMFQLIDQGILPSKFAQLKVDIPLCAYFIYGQAHRKSWRTRGKKLEISQDTDKAPGKGISTEQLVSGQPGPIPKIGCHITAARIWVANVFVDQFSDIFYVHLMLSTTQE